VSNISKREAMDRLLRVWEANPKLRLGQLLENATHDVSISYLFDDELVGLLELYLPPPKPRLARTAGG
jgi:hypothetical protein